MPTEAAQRGANRMRVSFPRGFSGEDGKARLAQIARALSVFDAEVVDATIEITVMGWTDSYPPTVGQLMEEARSRQRQVDLSRRDAMGKDRGEDTAPGFVAYLWQAAVLYALLKRGVRVEVPDLLWPYLEVCADVDLLPLYGVKSFRELDPSGPHRIRYRPNPDYDAGKVKAALEQAEAAWDAAGQPEPELVTVGEPLRAVE